MFVQATAAHEFARDRINVLARNAQQTFVRDGNLLQRLGAGIDNTGEEQGVWVLHASLDEVVLCMK
jgi:hypothetical protein